MGRKYPKPLFLHDLPAGIGLLDVKACILGERCLYSLTFLEEVFPEIQLPVYGILGNS
jgi:hypothetical protein